MTLADVSTPETVQVPQKNDTEEKDTRGLTRYLWNDDLNRLNANVLWWAWESVIHHMYFEVLFIMRQFAEQDESSLWTLNMEKEAESFASAFSGNTTVLAKQAGALAAGMWAGTPNPQPKDLNFMGRLITNFQHSEGIIHTWIIISGLLMIYKFGQCRTDEDVKRNISTPLRWSMFLALFIETWTMCAPYLIIFEWMWKPFRLENPRFGGAMSKTISDFGEQPFMDGFFIGAMLMAFLFVSIIVLILDGWAYHKFYQFLNVKSVMLDQLVYVVPVVIFSVVGQDFLREGPPENKPISNFIMSNLAAFPYNQIIPFLK